MADGLTDFLARVGPWRWGATDCVMIPADWVRETEGVDPAAAFRGRYHGWSSCERLLRAAGGLVHAVSSGMAGVGLRTTQRPVRGSVGLIRTPTAVGSEVRRRTVGAICVGEGSWAVMTDAGIIEVEMQHVIAWALPNG